MILTVGNARGLLGLGAEPIVSPAKHPFAARVPSGAAKPIRVRQGCQLAGVAQLEEQLICNQQVRGSSPRASSGLHYGESCPSGQREQTVNLPANAYGGSNPPLSTTTLSFATSRGSYCPPAWKRKKS